MIRVCREEGAKLDPRTDLGANQPSATQVFYVGFPPLADIRTNPLPPTRHVDKRNDCPQGPPPKGTVHELSPWLGLRVPVHADQHQLLPTGSRSPVAAKPVRRRNSACRKVEMGYLLSSFLWTYISA